MFNRRSICRTILSLTLTAALGSTPTGASEPAVPDSIPGAVKLNATEVIDLANRINDIIIIDARITADRTQGFIEGSVSLPDVDTTCTSLARIIPDNTSSVLFYCNGVKCGRSVKSVRIALKCGYRDVYWFRGGFEAWKKQGYPYITE